MTQGGAALAWQRWFADRYSDAQREADLRASKRPETIGRTMQNASEQAFVESLRRHGG